MKIDCELSEKSAKFIPTGNMANVKQVFFSRCSVHTVTLYSDVHVRTPQGSPAADDRGHWLSSPCRAGGWWHLGRGGGYIAIRITNPILSLRPAPVTANSHPLHLYVIRAGGRPANSQSDHTLCCSNAVPASQIVGQH